MGASCHLEQMSDVRQHLLSGICTVFNVRIYLDNFCAQAPFPDSHLPSFSNPVSPFLLAYLDHSHSRASRPYKDSPSAGRCPTQDKVSPHCPRENHPDLSLFQSSRRYSLHRPVDRFFLRGTRPLARHIRIVNPVHYHFLTGCVRM